MRFQDHPDPELNLLDDQIVKLAHCKLPLVRADWFVATATRPPLYDKLLQLPKDFPGLTKSMNLDIEADIKNFVAQRAGFQNSGVSRNNRMIERHPILVPLAALAMIALAGAAPYQSY